jgi:hypothetical protein
MKRKTAGETFQGTRLIGCRRNKLENAKAREEDISVILLYRTQVPPT